MAELTARDIVDRPIIKACPVGVVGKEKRNFRVRVDEVS